MAIAQPLRIPLGTSNAYLLPAQAGYALVDAGNPCMEFLLFAALRRHSIQPEEIKLIVITHAHLDHVGGLRTIARRCGNPPVLVHALEAPLLESGTVVFPAGTVPIGKVIHSVGVRLAPFIRFHGVAPAYRLAGAESLRDFGLDGRVLPTPGHTSGSVTILLDSGDAFVGDLCINVNPFVVGPVFPPFADDVAALYRSWKDVLDAGARRIFPGHGRPFAAHHLRAKLAERIAAHA